ncbi:MAG TPA: hypothetical protein VMV31_11140 [Terriglobales bacterium]|nr:hypothetical protein [Terriglobales bacterium]
MPGDRRRRLLQFAHQHRLPHPRHRLAAHPERRLRLLERLEVGGVAAASVHALQRHRLRVAAHHQAARRDHRRSVHRVGVVGDQEPRVELLHLFFDPRLRLRRALVAALLHAGGPVVIEARVLEVLPVLGHKPQRVLLFPQRLRRLEMPLDLARVHAAGGELRAVLG